MPELDAFITDIKATCARHGIGFELERGYSEDSSTDMLLVPYERADFDFITDDLDDYRGGIPWLDAAKAEWSRRQEAGYAARRAHEKAQAQAARQAKENAVLKDGVMLGGKKYKLVADD